MTPQDPPQIEFPCDYPIKVIGDNADDFHALVVETVKQHAPDLDESTVRLNPSRNGTFVSVRVVIRATGKQQLKALHVDLMATGRVKMVL